MEVGSSEMGVEGFQYRQFSIEDLNIEEKCIGSPPESANSA